VLALNRAITEVIWLGPEILLAVHVSVVGLVVPAGEVNVYVSPELSYTRVTDWAGLCVTVATILSPFVWRWAKFTGRELVGPL
jgi:hypothetical protein